MVAMFNPCFCLSLKDGCMIVGIWSLIWSIIQLGLFSWQTAVVKATRDRMENRRVPAFQSYSIYDNRLGGGDWNEIYLTPEEKIYTALFVMQILNLICAFGLLFASVSLLFGIHTNSRFLIWPWFPCIIFSIICSLTYCLLWWVGSAVGYQLALTVVEFFSVLINVYCVLCVFIHYRGITKGRGRSKRGKAAEPEPIYEYKISDGREPYSKKILDSGAYHPTLCYDNRMFEHEVAEPAAKVSLFEGPNNYRTVQQPTAPVDDGRQFFEPAAEPHLITFPSDDLSQRSRGKLTPAAAEELVRHDAEELRQQPQAEYRDTFRDEFLKQVVSKSDETPILPKITCRDHEERSPNKRRREFKHDAAKAGDRDRERKSRDEMERVERRRSRSHHRRSDDERPSCDLCRRGGGGDDMISDGRDGRDKRRSRSESRSTRPRTTCGHYERKKNREGSASAVESRALSSGGTKTAAEGVAHEAKARGGEKPKRSVRDVKREDQARQVQQSAATSRPVSVSPAVAASGINIPQNIVIPPQAGRTTPQKYQISSEVTISLNATADKSADSSRANSRQKQIDGTPQPPVSTAEQMLTSVKPVPLEKQSSKPSSVKSQASSKKKR